jgi:beta-lactamase regulating signal transducer with metallopeptidase domain
MTTSQIITIIGLFVISAVAIFTVLLFCIIFGLIRDEAKTKKQYKRDKVETLTGGLQNDRLYEKRT